MDTVHMQSGGLVDGTSYQIQVLAEINGQSLTRDEAWIIRHGAEKLIHEVLAERRKHDPKAQQNAADQRAQLVGCFTQPIYVKPIPNGYCDDWCCRHLPWFEVTTSRGPMVIGWRKRVISIDWSGSEITQTADELFPTEDTTKGGRLIHAWSVDKAREYVSKLVSCTEPVEKR